MNLCSNELSEISQSLNLFYERITPQITGGISQEQLSENHKTIGNDKICSICLEIVLNPVMCSKCENLFCNDCITKFLKNSNKCPNRCFFIEKEKNRMLKNILDILEFKCFYFKNGCSKIIPYA